MLQFIRAAAFLPEQSTGPSPPLLLIQTASLDPATPRGSLPRSPAHCSAGAPATCAPRSVSDAGACSHRRVSVRRCPPPRSVAKPVSVHLSRIPRYAAHTEYGSMSRCGCRQSSGAYVTFRAPHLVATAGRPQGRNPLRLVSLLFLNIPLLSILLTLSQSRPAWSFTWMAAAATSLGSCWDTPYTHTHTVTQRRLTTHT